MIEVVSPDWSAPAQVQAFTTTRSGGVSKGRYAELNLGLHVDDDRNHVLRNRQLLQAQFSLPAEPLWLQQVHGTEIHRANDHHLPDFPADAVITAVPGIVCCVMTADCMPLFLCDRLGREIAAVHAGWRGMAAGIIERTVKQFAAPADELLAWAGPCISVAHFEVGLEVREQLGGSDAAWLPGPTKDKLYANLYRLAGERLQTLGVTDYGHSEACTFADEKRYFSHRRDGHCGRQASLIYLRG